LLKYPTFRYGTLDSDQLNVGLDFTVIMNAYFYQLVDITIFMLVGFAFLIVYLRFHRWSSLGFSFFTCAFVI